MNKLGIGFLGLFVSAAAVLPCAAADPTPSKTKRNAVGIGVLYHSPGDPLDDGVGFGVQYTRSLSRLLLRGELAALSLDVEGQQSEIDFLLLSVGVLWPVSPESWRVRLAVGGGVDYVDGDGGGDTQIEPPPLDIRSTVEVDSGAGFHADFEATLPIGSSWQLFGRVRYLIATLDAEESFVITGVPGAPTSLDLELDGPQLTIGAEFRF